MATSDDAVMPCSAFSKQGDSLILGSLMWRRCCLALKSCGCHLNLTTSLDATVTHSRQQGFLEWADPITN